MESAQQFPFYASQDSRSLSSLPASLLSIHPWPSSPPISFVPCHFLPSTYSICHLLASPIQILLLRSVYPLSLSCLVSWALGWKERRSIEFNLTTHTAFLAACSLSEALLLGLAPWLLLFCTFTLR